MAPDSTAIRKGLLDYAAEAVAVDLERGKTWDHSRNDFNHQAIRAYAYLYTREESPLKEDGKLADAIRDLSSAIGKFEVPPSNRLTVMMADARRLLHDAGALDLMPRVDEMMLAGAESLAEHLMLYRHLTNFAAANTGTGTNHVAVYGNAVYRVGELLGMDDLMALAEEIWEPLARDMHPDGYWAEANGGPAVGYNNLTLVCCGRMGLWTGKALYRDAAQTSARFHRLFCYPDTSKLESFDGRQRYHPNQVGTWASFVHSETPEGRGFVHRRIESLRMYSPASEGSGGQTLAGLCEDHEWWVDGPVAPAECDREHYTEMLDSRGGVRRDGPWCFTLQGITHLPIGTGGFFVDRSSPFSLWHEKTGLIVNGSGEPDEHAAQMFKIRPIYNRNSYSVPEQTSIDLGSLGAPATLTSEYRGGTAHLQVRTLSDTAVELEVRVGVRSDRYPVEVTLQLELREGDFVNGTELTTKELRLTESKLAGVVDSEKFRISFPEGGARLVWPHIPYHPYRGDPPSNTLVSLLHLPVGPDGAKLVFEAKA